MRNTLKDFKMKLTQMPQSVELKASVSALEVSDNSGDERFPFIFMNKPGVDGQKELVTFDFLSFEDSSPLFTDVENQIELGFSGLIAYWKPQTMHNLLMFMNKSNSGSKPASSKAAE